MAVGSIITAKDLEEGYQPLLLLVFTFRDSDVSPTILRVATHGLRAADAGFVPSGITGFPHNGQEFVARVLNQGITATQALEQGIDITPTLTVSLADADKTMWTTYERPIGFKGAILDAYFIFWNVGVDDFSSDFGCVFHGICGPGQINEDTLDVRATSKLNMNQITLPGTQAQQRCPWIYTNTVGLSLAEATVRHQAAADDPSSPFNRCGYSPLAVGPNARGNKDGPTNPFTTCDRTFAACVVRLGDSTNVWSKGVNPAPIEQDESGRDTGHFGGSQWDPPKSFISKGFGQSDFEEILTNSNEQKIGQRIPLVFGTAWTDPIILNVVGDANLTRMEVAVCTGEVSNIRRVVVNDIQVDEKSTVTSIFDQQLAIALWWEFVNNGTRKGDVNEDTLYDGTGDPYGNICVLSITIPRRLSPSSSIPRVRVLLDGPKINVFETGFTITNATNATPIVVTTSASHGYIDGDTVLIQNVAGNPATNGLWIINQLTSTTYELNDSVGNGTYDSGGVSHKYDLAFSKNPAWNLMDVLIQTTWRYIELDIQTFFDAATFCAVTISFTNIFGNAGTHPRYEIGFTLAKPMNTSQLIRRIRASCRGLLRPNDTGQLQLLIEQTLAGQQPAAISGSNWNTAIESKNAAGATTDGFVAYKFDYNSILRERGSKSSSLKITQSPIENTPNKIRVPYTEQELQFTPDSATVLDDKDIDRIDQEVDGTPSIQAIGILSFDQAIRTAAFIFARNYRGNNRSAATAGDTGGTFQFNLTTSFKAQHLRIGHIVLVDYPQLTLNASLESPPATPIDGFLAKVLAIKPATNFERAQIKVAYHNDDWYVDTFGQENSPTASGLFRDRLVRPALPWLPNEETPITNNPLWSVTALGFSIKQVYESGADNRSIPKVVIRGQLPVNTFAGNGLNPPAIALQGTTAPSGGTIEAGVKYYALVVAKDTNGKLTPPSDPDAPCEIVVPAGANTATITIPITEWRVGTTDYEIFVGNLRHKLSHQGSAAVTPPSTPASITLTVLNESTWGLPDVEFDRITVRAQRALHLGVVGIEIVAVTATTIQVSLFSDNQFATNQFAPSSGNPYYLTVVGLFDNEENLPILDFEVLSNTGDTFTLAASQPDPTTIDRGDGTTGLQVKDVIIVRMRPTAGSDGGGNFIQDANWSNASNTFLVPVAVTDATNATPIVITIAEDKGWVDQDRVYITGVLGNAAANGVRFIDRLTATTYGLYSDKPLTAAIVGSGAYTSGGIAKQQVEGLIVNDEIGRELYIVRGKGTGTYAKVLSNTSDKIYIEGEWIVVPDESSIIIVLDPGWVQTMETDAINNSDPTTSIDLSLEVANYLNRQLFVQAFTMDGGRNESFRSLSPFRELWIFGTSIGSVTAPIKVEVPDGSNKVYPNLTESTRFLVIDAPADFTIELPEYRTSASTPGTGSPPLGTEDIVISVRHGSTPRVVTWGTGYSGVSANKFPSSPLANHKDNWGFDIESPAITVLKNHSLTDET